MNQYQIATDIIKQSVSALDVATALGWEVQHGRCKCPIHNGDGYNCKLYPGNRGYMCWVCKSAGDVISLVRNYYSDMSYRQCLLWFRDTFHLPLDLEGNIDPAKQKAAEKALQMRKNAIAFEEWKKQFRFDLALTADEIVRKLEKQRDANLPKTPDEEWNVMFCEAVTLLPAARRFADDCWMECMEVRR